ncbi:ATP-binding protein [Streptomyces sp. NBC_01431]|uniref:ATP-binding protein n=1 Tax=Streptomyces sp. NBC_01431 TaxID=2903863 RepID=UPI002E319621|nr:ATP-binding protein [Streptomyces sp. NBC_01431]
MPWRSCDGSVPVHCPTAGTFRGVDRPAHAHRGTGVCPPRDRAPPPRSPWPTRSPYAGGKPMSPARPPRDTIHVVWRWTNCTPSPTTRARAALRCALDQLGYEGEVISDAVLAVSELVANATEHAVGPYEMRLRSTAAEVICEIWDCDPRVPELPAFPAAAPFAPVEEGRGGGLDALCALLSERGRGLLIVNELTKGAWGFRREARSKAAWLAIPLTPGGHVR